MNMNEEDLSPEKESRNPIGSFDLIEFPDSHGRKDDGLTQVSTFQAEANAQRKKWNGRDLLL
jgi:hypothetical protein